MDNCKKYKVYALLSGVLALLFGGCSNELKVNAPKKDIIIVYGILNPQASEQVIRVSKAFLTEGDAVKFASDNDLTLKNAVVTLSFVNLQGQAQTLTLTPKDTTRMEGNFTQKMTVYTTRGRIYEGFKYQLRVEGNLEEGGPKVVATAYTYVPERPTMLKPDDTRLKGNPENPPEEQNIEAYPRAAFNDDNYFIRFNKGASTGSRKVYGRAFEYRVYLNYTEEGSTQPMTAKYASAMFSESNTACSGNFGPEVVCYRIGKEFLNYLRATMNPAKKYQYDASNLAKSTSIEITAIDTFLYDYMRVNSPAFTDFTTIKPEYTNINGGLGIFGSINTRSANVRLNPCTRYLLHLNNEPQPASKCE